jgi:hypothetical protein
MNSSGKLALAAVMTMGIAPASASTVGVAVAALGSSAQVGLPPQNDALFATRISQWNRKLNCPGSWSRHHRRCPNKSGSPSADLDLVGANHPANFFESLNALNSANVLNSANASLTGPISNIGGPATGVSNVQTPNLAFNAPADPLDLELQQFKAISPVPLSPMPLPATVLMMLAGWYMWRKSTKATA